MKVIDLLSNIANGEEVPNFIVDEVEYYMGANGYLRECMGDDVEWYIDKSWLNTEVQIIEEDKKIEKLNDILRVDDLIPPVDENVYKIWTQTIKNHNKLNEIIEEINNLKENK